jgi:hypothetical protein
MNRHFETPQDHELEVIKLRPDRVEHDQRGWAGPRLQVPQAVPVRELEVVDLA